MGRQRRGEGLVDAQEAVSDYLDALLGPVALEPAAASASGAGEAAAGRQPIPPVVEQKAAPSPERPPAAIAIPAAKKPTPRPTSRAYAEPSAALHNLPLLLPCLPETSEASAEPPPPEPASAPVVAPSPLPATRAGVDLATPAIRPPSPPAEPVRHAAPPPSPPSPPAAGVPAWAASPFPCLGFKVAGVNLAAPLEKLHGIVPWDGETTELPGYPDWFLGLVPNRGQNVRLIDTARIIMPDGRLPDARPVRERLRYLVLIDGGRWGLAADGIGEVMTLDEAGVKWRGPGGRRPWLAGTAVASMCAVLDMDSLAEQLAAGLQGLDDEQA